MDLPSLAVQAFVYMMAVQTAVTGPLAPPESGEEREARLGQTSFIAAAEARTRPMMFAVLVLTRFESGAWDPRIHAGDPHPVWTQDRGLATCVGQLHASERALPPARWATLAGTTPEATQRCLYETTRHLRGAMRWCRVGFTEDGLARAYAAYATGYSCAPSKDSKMRAHEWAKAVATGRP